MLQRLFAVLATFYVFGFAPGALAESPPAATRPNHQGLWWSPEEPGWGLGLAQQGETAFAVWFTYDAEGRPMWALMPDAAPLGEGAWRGRMFYLKGGGIAVPLQLTASTQAAQQVADVELRFDSLDAGAMLVASAAGHRAIPLERQVFASPVHRCRSFEFPGRHSYQDLWGVVPFGARTSWGVFIAQQGEVLFALVYGFDRDYRPTWMVASDLRSTSAGTYRGTLYQTTGTPFYQRWDGARFSVRRAGEVELQLVAGDAGQVTLQFDEGHVERKMMTRQRFGTVPAGCR